MAPTSILPSEAVTLVHELQGLERRRADLPHRHFSKDAARVSAIADACGAHAAKRDQLLAMSFARPERRDWVEARFLVEATHVQRLRAVVAAPSELDAKDMNRALRLALVAEAVPKPAAAAFNQVIAACHFWRATLATVPGPLRDRLLAQAAVMETLVGLRRGAALDMSDATELGVFIMCLRRHACTQGRELSITSGGDGPLMLYEGHRASLAAAGRAHVELVVFDDSSGDVAMENRRIVDALQGAGGRVRYVGSAEKRAVRQALAADLTGVADDVLDSVLGGERSDGTWRGGAHCQRNWVALWFAGQRVVVADDDTQPAQMLERDSTAAASLLANELLTSSPSIVTPLPERLRHMVPGGFAGARGLRCPSRRQLRQRDVALLRGPLGVLPHSRSSAASSRLSNMSSSIGNPVTIRPTDRSTAPATMPVEPASTGPAKAETTSLAPERVGPVPLGQTHPAGVTRAAASLVAAQHGTLATPTFTARYDLAFVDDESAKFWSGEQRGSDYTVSWGRLGTRGQSKTFAAESVEAATRALAARAAEKIASGYGDADVSYRVVLGKKGVDQVGGIPPGVSAEAWPVCAGCASPMTFVELFSAAPERLPLVRHAAIAVFQCENPETAGTCETWAPDKKANAALVLTSHDLTRPPLEAAPRAQRGATPVLPAQAASYVRILTPKDEEEAEGTSHVGGAPVWVQDEQIPDCDCCKKPMRFVAQLESADVGANFGDAGAGYVFLCEEEKSAKFFWQCG